MKMVKEVKKLDEDTREAVGRVAAGYKFVVELADELKEIELEKDTHKAVREVKQGLRILRWIGKAEKKIDRSEKKIIADLEELKELNLPMQLKTEDENLAEQLKVAESQLVKLASMFTGKVKKELEEIMTDEALLAEYEENFEMTDKIHDHLKELFAETKSEVAKLQKWIGSTQQILRSIRGFAKTLEKLSK